MKDDKRAIKPEALEKLRLTILQLFSDGQYHEITIREICSSAGVSPQTVYKYFGNKEALLLACVEQNLAEITQRCLERIDVNMDLKSLFYVLCNTQFEYYQENPIIAKIVFLNLPPVYWVRRQSPAQSEFQNLLLHGLEIAKKQSVFSDETDVVLIQDTVTGAASRIINRWLVEDCKYSLVEKGDAMFELVWRTLSPD